VASENNKKLQQAFGTLLKAQGFKKDGATWRKHNPETIIVFNIQGSQWGPQFYVNLGILFRDLDNNEKPLEYKCHIRLRLEGVVQEPNRIGQLLNFDLPMDEAVRLAELSSFVANHALPFLDGFSTREKAKSLLDEFPRQIIPDQYRDELGLA
jgi:hypothetical protein